MWPARDLQIAMEVAVFGIPTNRKSLLEASMTWEAIGGPRCGAYINASRLLTLLLDAFGQSNIHFDFLENTLPHTRLKGSPRGFFLPRFQVGRTH